MKPVTAQGRDKPRRDTSTEPHTRAGWSSRMDTQGRSGTVPRATKRSKVATAKTSSTWQAIAARHMRAGTLPPLESKPSHSCIYKVGKYGYTAHYKDALSYSYLKRLETNELIEVIAVDC